MCNIFFKLRFSLFFFLLSLGYLVNAQQFLTFSDNNEKINYKAISDCQISYLFKMYNQRIDVSNKLINGRDYVPYYYRSESKPLLFSEKERSGSLVLNGRKYDNLKLEYDTYLDELIYSDWTKFFPDKYLMIALNKDPVDVFKLYFEDDSIIFRYFKSGNGVKFNLPEGFYEVVYNGNSKYIIKHQSLVIQTESIDEYLYSPAGYVMVGENYFRVRSKKEFIKLFGEKSKEIKGFIRISKIHNRKMDKKQIASVLMFYDTVLSSNKQPK
jgi:hypothetical protein